MHNFCYGTFLKIEVDIQVVKGMYVAKFYFFWQFYICHLWYTLDSIIFNGMI